MSKLTSAQTLTVERITTDRIGRRDTVSLEAWRKAFAFTAWELFRV
jgi:hypothetical protein